MIWTAVGALEGLLAGVAAAAAGDYRPRAVSRKRRRGVDLHLDKAVAEAGVELTMKNKDE